MTRQLQCEINDEARMKIQAIIHGFFDGASEDLRSKKIIIKSKLVYEVDSTLSDEQKSGATYPSEERSMLKKKQLGG